MSKSSVCRNTFHTEFQVDVRDLGIKQSRNLSDIAIPQGVKPLAKMDEVVVVVSKRAAT